MTVTRTVTALLRQRRVPTAAGVAALLALYLVLALTAARWNGVTADEVVHLTGGYSYWHFNDYRLQPENGTLPMRMAALPLLAMDLRWVAPDDPHWLGSIVSRLGHDFLYNLGNPFEAMLLAGRLMITGFGLVTLWLVWRWARGLFGPSAGWLALTLAVLCPALLAHGAFITSDLAITASLLGVVTAFWLLLHRMTWLRLAVATAAGGLVLLAKMSGVLAAPVLVILMVFRTLHGAPLVVELGRGGVRLRSRAAIGGAVTAAGVAVAAGSLAILWAGYGFRYSAFRAEDRADSRFYLSWPVILEEEGMTAQASAGYRSPFARKAPAASPTAGTRLIGWLRQHELLPEAYLWGMAHTYKFSRARSAFLDSEYRREGWPQFFPLAFWYKTTLPALLLLAAGLAIAARKAARDGRLLYRAAPLLVLVLLYWQTALGMKLNIGHRHILPVYPVVYILAGAAVLWLPRIRRPLGALVLGAAVVAHASDSFSARPFYLSHFQPLAGGTSEGWRHLVDSSFDWGQGLPDLGRWLNALRASGDDRPVFLCYFGADSPQARKLPVTRFGDELFDNSRPRTFPAQLKGGWYAISATQFQQVYMDIKPPWDARQERIYARLLADLNSLGRANPADDTTTRERLLGTAVDLELMQFGRLRHFLRDRAPEAIVGGSILVFRLTDAEVSAALFGRLPGLDSR